MPKRSFLLTLFFLFGFLPMLVLLLLGIYRKTGFCVRNYTAFVQSQIGLPVQISGVKFHTPLSGEIRELTIFQPGLSDDGKRHPLATVPSAEWLQYKVLHEGKEVQMTKWTLPELTLDSHCLEPFWRSHQQILANYRKSQNLFRDSEILFRVEGPVKIGQGESAVELRKTELRIRQENGDPQTILRFYVPDSGREAQIQLNFNYIVHSTAQIMQATLVTDTAGIPVKYLRTIFPMLDSLGPECRFTGSIVIRQSFSRWSGAFRGKFEHIDAESYFPNQVIKGLGMIEVTKARFESARLAYAEGTFRLENGLISRPFLEWIQRTLRFISGDWPAGPEIPLKEMAFHFKMDESQIQLTGCCTGTMPGVLANGHEGPLLVPSPSSNGIFSRPILWENIRRVTN